MQVRSMGQDYSDVPRWWYDDNPVMSHVVNGMNMLFPEGERFFIRSVKHYLPQLKDPTLRSEVRDFFSQEAMHGAEHERALQVLRQQGYAIDDWLDWYRKLAFKRIEPAAPKLLNLAVTAAAEHFTASFAQFALSSNDLDSAHPTMRHLMRWHAAEEIEHKAVAYDVFCAVGGGYLTRMLGLVTASVLFVVFWRSATKHLLRQEVALDPGVLKQHRRQIRRKRQQRAVLLREAFVSYMRPGFHPNDIDNYVLAETWLDSVGRLYG